MAVEQRLDEKRKFVARFCHLRGQSRDRSGEPQGSQVLRVATRGQQRQRSESAGPVMFLPLLAVDSGLIWFSVTRMVSVSLQPCLPSIDDAGIHA